MVQTFNGKVFMLGYGAVAQCALPLVVKLMKVAPKNITVMDFENRRPELKEWIARGVKFVHDRITRANMTARLARYCKPGTLLIDLAWNIDCIEIVQWCHDHGVPYINTSVELWDPYVNAEKQTPQQKTLYWRHMNLRRRTKTWSEPGPTAVLEHGANPGLISHWTKRGLLDIADRLLAEKKVKGRKAEAIRGYAAARTFNELARELDVKVIHVSERDTQVSDRPKRVDEFVNTWSIEGFREEGITTAELGWGTHEKELPPLAFTHPDGPRNQICLARMGMNTWVRSWVPHMPIRGMVVRHGEAFTISDHLTVRRGGKAVYRPTVHYAYQCCDAAIASLWELRARDYALQPKLRIMNDEITEGADILGALLMGHAYNSWWTGSDLSIAQSRKLVPHQNATTLQVAISVVAAAMWITDPKQPANFSRGVLAPDDLPHDYVLTIADPYLGRNLSLPSDWTPLKDLGRPFGTYAPQDVDRRDPWQFKNFLVQE